MSVASKPSTGREECCHLRIESKYAACAAAAGFLLAWVLSHGSLAAGFSAFALIAGPGWVAHGQFHGKRREAHNE